MIDINKFLKSILCNNYILIKTDVPYMPLDFPEKYPIGKDMDVISTDDYNNIVNKIIIFSKVYNDIFDIRTIIKDNNFRLRFEKNKKLHYQIDISNEFYSLPYWFIKNSIDNKILKDNKYYIPEIRYEVIYRYYAFINNVKKIYHREYIKKYIKNVDKDIISRVDLNFIGNL